MQQYVYNGHLVTASSREEASKAMARKINAESKGTKYGMASACSDFEAAGFVELGKTTDKKAVYYKNAYATVAPNEDVTVCGIATIEGDSVTLQLFNHSAAEGTKNPLVTKKLSIGNAKSCAKGFAKSVDSLLKALTL